MRRILIALLVVAGLGLVARGALPCDLLSAQPGCYVILHPGPTEDTFGLVEIPNESTFASTGEFVLTTVAVDSDVDVLDWLRATFDDATVTVRRDLLFPGDADEAEVRRQNAALMDESQLDAVIAALQAIDGRVVEPVPAAVEVTEVLPDSPASRLGIEVGDLIRSVDGEPVTTADGAVDRIGRHAVGETVSLRIERTDGTTEDLEAVLADSATEPGSAVLGVIVATRFDLPIDVRIDAGGIAGPSGGLMFALTVVDLFGPDDLTGGAVIAGTGTIDRDGRVGAIGGIQQKILGALHRGDDRPAATVFLVPRRNYDEARATPVDREVLLIPVDTLGDALAALRGLLDDQRPRDAIALGPRP